jgi:UDP-N-acetylglucosamine acyltransferase
MPPAIHPTAVVDPSAKLAEGVRVGPYCVIGPEVTIGEGTELRNHVVIESHTRIGRECVLFHFAALGGTPQDRKFRGEITWCEIGDRNHIREHVTVHRGTGNGGGLTRIGHDNLIMAGAHVAHDCMVGDRVTIANEVMLAGHVTVLDGASVAGGTGLHHFVTVGRAAFVAAMARVERDVPPFMIFEGSPAIVRSPNKIGLERGGFAPVEIEAIRTAYKRLFGPRAERSSGPMLERVEQLRREFPGLAAVRELCDFVVRSESSAKGRALEGERLDDKRARVTRTSGSASIAASAPAAMPAPGAAIR